MQAYETLAAMPCLPLQRTWTNYINAPFGYFFSFSRPNRLKGLAGGEKINN